MLFTPAGHTPCRLFPLLQLDTPAMIPHTADVQGRRVPYEVVFRTVHKLLLDTATSEYLFTLDFFEDDNVFKELYGHVVSVVEADLNASIQVRQRNDLLILEGGKLCQPGMDGRKKTVMSRKQMRC